MWTAVWVPLMVTIAGGWLLAGGNNNADDEQPRRVVKSIPLTSLQCCCCCNSRINLSIPSHRLLEAAAAASGLLTSVGISECLTRLGKASFGRRRPNFYDFCDFDYATRQCAAASERVCAAQHSFPSGHASLACCAMVYLSCFFGGKILSSSSSNNNRWCLQQRRHKMLWCTAVATLLLSYAVFVAATRVTDHWHKPGDVLAGLLLGGATAFAVYHLYYPPLWNARAAGTPRTGGALLLVKSSASQQPTTNNDTTTGDVATVSSIATGERGMVVVSSSSQPAKLGGVQQPKLSDLAVVLV